MTDVQNPRDADLITPRPEKKQRTEPPQVAASKKETAQEFVLVRRGDAGSSNPEWCAQRYGCIAYFNEKARDEDALQELIAPLLKADAGTAVVRALVGARALALHYAEKESHAEKKQNCQGCAWKKYAKAESGEEMQTPDKKDFLKLKHDVANLYRAIVLLITVLVLYILYDVSGHAGAAYQVHMQEVHKVSQPEIPTSSSIAVAKKKKGSMSFSEETTTPNPGQKCKASVEIDNERTCLSDLVLPLAACPTAVDYEVTNLAGNESYNVSVCAGDLAVQEGQYLTKLTSEVSAGFTYLYDLILNSTTASAPPSNNMVFPTSDATNNALLQSFLCPFCGKEGKGWWNPTDKSELYAIDELISGGNQIYYKMTLRSWRVCMPQPNNGRRRNMAEDLIACSKCYRFMETPYGYMPLKFNASAPEGPGPNGFVEKWNTPVDIIFPYWVPVDPTNKTYGGTRQIQCPKQYVTQDASNKVFLYQKSTFIDFVQNGVPYHYTGVNDMCSILTEKKTHVAIMTWRGCFNFLSEPG
eukprot:g47313.t1